MKHFRPGMLLLLVLFVQCKPESLVQQDVNPNGSSELALLMRNMFDDGMQVKSDVLNGKKATVECDYTAIHTAAATQPEKVATPTFKTFSAAYEAAVSDLNQAPAGQQRGPYTHMVNTCIQCHQEFCTGPLRKIRKMELPEEE